MKFQVYCRMSTDIKTIPTSSFPLLFVSRGPMDSLRLAPADAAFGVGIFFKGELRNSGLVPLFSRLPTLLTGDLDLITSGDLSYAFEN